MGRHQKNFEMHVRKSLDEMVGSTMDMKGDSGLFSDRNEDRVIGN